MSYKYARSKRTRSSNFSRGKKYNNRPRNNNSRGYNQKSNIDPSMFIRKAKPIEEDVYVPINSFSDFDLDERIKKNLIEKGYVTPSPIQDQSIPAGIEGKDIIGIAGTGTGKTAAFMLPIIQKLINDPRSAALIIAPTRELAQQIRQESRSFTKDIYGLNDALIIGGKGMMPQLRDLKRRPRIVIGTPGRIKDHINRGSLRLKFFNLVVLDEVDRMLDMGFVNDVTSIMNEMNQENQSFFFSATFDDKVRQLITQFTKDPLTVALKVSTASENVNQDIVKYKEDIDKLEMLHDILIQNHVEKVIVFNETQRNSEKLRNQLAERGFNAESIHGGKSQGQRQRALDKFKRSEINILVATDVAARGIDVSDITHVINYTAPKEYQDYIHRIGRAGRAGKVGHALTFVKSRL